MTDGRISGLDGKQEYEVTGLQPTAVENRICYR